MLKHHFIEGVDGEVPVRVGIFQSGHGSVKRVGLVAERRVLHRDDLEGVLENGEGLEALAEQNTIEHKACFDAYLCYVLGRLAKGLKDLLVVLQIDVCEHVCGDFVSFSQVRLQALIIDLALKLCYDRPRLNQADAGERSHKLFVYDRGAFFQPPAWSCPA